MFTLPTPTQFSAFKAGIGLLTLLVGACVQAATYQPSAAEQARADQAYRAFSTAMRDADYERAYQQLHARLKKAQSLTEWRAGEERFARAAGTLVGFFNPRASWHFDPPNALEPGFYVEYRHQCRYARLDPCYEILVLFSPMGEHFSLIRHSRHYINTQTGKRSGEFIHIPGQHSRIRQ
ncbi:hypothetical protein KO507_11060 [Gilvimarinus agarilyticus]|uniref:hypothetical protein n=1 Tax=unclassified Gilvimarinus TaxID=2642066 RepID=UPI001C09168F|nr:MULTISPECIES: hypothetical protein [unclassified Gilvimarinus]MBU2886303.1 hypothetical protein [Gilvimarinus agarilyticus]MDO6570989.1 hypothetical protein [Gilvimarinus sp. 2_MG-2023]MDO6747844.1 hypothetical protein [Gilvimarinus sp. 1_MG-2023]